MPKTATLSLKDVDFNIEYTPQTDKMEQTSVKVGHFEMFCLDEKAEEVGELTDSKKMMEFVQASLKERLLDYLTDNDYKKIYSLFKIHPFAVDTAIFTIMISHYWDSSDQALELTSTVLVGNTVTGKKYAEHMRNG